MRTNVDKQNDIVRYEYKFYTIVIIDPESPIFFVFPMQFMCAQAKIKRIFAKDSFTRLSTRFYTHRQNPVPLIEKRRCVNF
jgi:hypothetical protein